MTGLMKILFLLNLTACSSWSWKADVYSPDASSQSISNESGDVVRCNEPRIEEFMCFSEDNMAELIKNIEMVKRKEKVLKLK